RPVYLPAAPKSRDAAPLTSGGRCHDKSGRTHVRRRIDGFRPPRLMRGDEGERMSTAGLPIAKGEQVLEVVPGMANRHGLTAGATGTGKTVSLRVLAEQFSRIGVPVFLADIKGDLSGIARPGGDNPKVAERAKQLGLTLTPTGCPVVFWDLFGKQ